MIPTLPLETMTQAEKIQLMEVLWADLTREEDALESPPWHEEELRERDRRLENGEDYLMDWEEGKALIRRRTGL